MSYLLRVSNQSARRGRKKLLHQVTELLLTQTRAKVCTPVLKQASQLGFIPVSARLHREHPSEECRHLPHMQVDRGTPQGQCCPEGMGLPWGINQCFLQIIQRDKGTRAPSVSDAYKWDAWFVETQEAILGMLLLPLVAGTVPGADELLLWGRCSKGGKLGGCREIILFQNMEMCTWKQMAYLLWKWKRAHHALKKFLHVFPKLPSFPVLGTPPHCNTFLGMFFPCQHQQGKTSVRIAVLYQLLLLP